MFPFLAAHRAEVFPAVAYAGLLPPQGVGRPCASRSFRDKLILLLFPLFSGGAGAGLVYYPCQRLGA